MRLIAYLIVCVFLPLESYSQVNGRCELVAGYDRVEPFHFPKDGKIVGIDAEILNQGAKKIGCAVTYKELPWARTLSLLERGEIDVAIGASFKESRAKWAYYSVPYKFIDHWLYTRIDKHQQVVSIEGFFENQLSLGAVIGWGYPVEVSQALAKKSNANNISRVSTFEQLPKMLRRGRVDGIIASPTALEKEIGKNINKFASRAQYKEELHFMFSKQSVASDVVARFNNAIYEIIYSGDRKEIFNKYQK